MGSVHAHQGMEHYISRRWMLLFPLSENICLVRPDGKSGEAADGR